MAGEPGNEAPNARSDDLAARLLAVSELHGDFVLSSGRRSSVYFDKFRFLADPALLREVAGRVRELLPAGVTHLAAPEGAATLLLAAVALETGRTVACIILALDRGGADQLRAAGYEVEAVVSVSSAE